MAVKEQQPTIQTGPNVDRLSWPHLPSLAQKERAEVGVGHSDRVAHADVLKTAGLTQPIDGIRGQPQSSSNFANGQVGASAHRPTTTGYRIFLYHYCTK
jgi:hypothetical protein